MQFSVYADLSRQLTLEERTAVGEALDAIVPDGGCVGPQRRQDFEVYFVVEAANSEEAREQATRYMDSLLRRSEVELDYEISLHLLSL